MYGLHAQVRLLAIMRRHEGDFAASRLLWYNLICVKFSRFGALKPMQSALKPPDSGIFEHIVNIWTAFIALCGTILGFVSDCVKCILSASFNIWCVSLQVQSTSWMPHQQYVMQPTVSTLPFTCSNCPWLSIVAKAWLQNVWFGFSFFFLRSVFFHSCWKALEGTR